MTKENRKNYRDPVCICGHPKSRHNLSRFNLCSVPGCYCSKFVKAEGQDGGEGECDEKE